MKKVAIVSTKGGVGKTTIAANLAVSLHDLGYTVGALDLDSSSPTLHIAFGVAEPPKWGTNTATSQIVPTRLVNSIELVTMASHWAKDKRVSWRGNDKAELTRQLLSDMIGWGELDLLCIDSPPSMSEEIFILTSDTSITGYIVVTQPQPMAIADIERLVDFCRAGSLPVFGIVSNFDGCVSPTGLVFYPYLGGRVNVKEWAEKHDVPFLASIPQSSRLEELKPVFESLARKIATGAPCVLPRGDTRRQFKREVVKIAAEELTNGG